MSSTSQLLQGYINSTHTSSLTSFYQPRNLPTPWPIAAASLIFCAAISVYGTKTSFHSWHGAVKERPRKLKPKSKPKPTWFQKRRERKEEKRAIPVDPESELLELHGPNEGPTQQGLKDDTSSKHTVGPDDDDISYGGNDNNSSTSTDLLSQPFRYSGDPTVCESSDEFMPAPKWNVGGLEKVVKTTLCAYLTYCAIIGFTVAILGFINHAIPAPGPAQLFLLFLAIQPVLANRSIPRLMNLIYTVDIVIVAVAFLTVSYGPRIDPTRPSYAALSVSGGNCAVPAGDCHTQVTHWTTLGCANYTDYIDLEDHDETTPEDDFYVPYSTTVSIDSVANQLHYTVAVCSYIGTAWMVTILVHIFQAHNLFVRPVLSNLQRPLGPFPMNNYDDFYDDFIGTATLLNNIIAIPIALTALIVHITQATGRPGQSITYIDSFGPGTTANFTRNLEGYMNSTQYWGDEHSWNDCFTIDSPTIGTGWAMWAAANGRWAVARTLAGL